MEPDSKGISIVLFITDHFTWCAQAFPTENQMALTVVKILYFVHYGLQTWIHSNKEKDFESQLVKKLLAVLGIRKSRTSPYHPQGDPQPERFNQTLLSMLGTQEKEQNWSQYVTQLGSCNLDWIFCSKMGNKNEWLFDFCFKIQKSKYKAFCLHGQKCITEM